MQSFAQQREKGGAKKFGTYDIVMVGVLSAVVFVSNFLSIPIGDITRIHFGNVFCVLSGLLLGSLRGGLCAGIGSFFYDLCNPLYASEALITFCMKFVMGFTAGAVSHMGGRKGEKFSANLTGAISGSAAYIIVYLVKNFIREYWLIKNPIDTVFALLLTKGATSVLNAIIAVCVAMLLAPALRSVLKRSRIWEKLGK